MLERYTLAFGTAMAAPQTYFDFDHDAILLDWSSRDPRSIHLCFGFRDGDFSSDAAKVRALTVNDYEWRRVFLKAGQATHSGYTEVS